MANGTMVDQATYFHDTTKYTGTSGTETNMWVIEDVFDLCSVTSPTSANYHYYYMVNDIDFNDHPTYRYGISNIIFGWTATGSKPYLYCNNHAIKNLVVKNYANAGTNSCVFMANGVYDAMFLNLVFASSGARLFSNTSTGTYPISNCKFAISLFNSPTSCLWGPNAQYKIEYRDCSINISGITNDNNLEMSYSYLLRCRINFNKLRLNNYSSFDCNILRTTSNVTWDEVYFTGHLMHRQTTGNSYLFLPSSNNQITMINCQIRFKYTNYEGVQPSNFLMYKSYAPLVSAVSFVDTDLISSSGDYLPVSNLLYLTDDQCKDAQYLLDQGFPVMVG